MTVQFQIYGTIAQLRTPYDNISRKYRTQVEYSQFGPTIFRRIMPTGIMISKLIIWNYQPTTQN